MKSKKIMICSSILSVVSMVAISSSCTQKNNQNEKPNQNIISEKLEIKKNFSNSEKNPSESKNNSSSITSSSSSSFSNNNNNLDKSKKTDKNTNNDTSLNKEKTKQKTKPLFNNEKNKIKLINKKDDHSTITPPPPTTTTTTTTTAVTEKKTINSTNNEQNKIVSTNSGVQTFHNSPISDEHNKDENFNLKIELKAKKDQNNKNIINTNLNEAIFTLELDIDMKKLSVIKEKIDIHATLISKENALHKIQSTSFEVIEKGIKFNFNKNNLISNKTYVLESIKWAIGNAKASDDEIINSYKNLDNIVEDNIIFETEPGITSVLFNDQTNSYFNFDTSATYPNPIKITFQLGTLDNSFQNIENIDKTNTPIKLKIKQVKTDNLFSENGNSEFIPKIWKVENKIANVEFEIKIPYEDTLFIIEEIILTKSIFNRENYSSIKLNDIPEEQRAFITKEDPINLKKIEANDYKENSSKSNEIKLFFDKLTQKLLKGFIIVEYINENENENILETGIVDIESLPSSKISENNASITISLPIKDSDYGFDYSLESANFISDDGEYIDLLDKKEIISFFSTS